MMFHAAIVDFLGGALAIDYRDRGPMQACLQDCNGDGPLAVSNYSGPIPKASGGTWRSSNSRRAGFK